MKNAILLLLLSVLLFFSFLGETSVFQVAEARNADCAKEMIENHNWVVPTFNGELRTDKPVLAYYGMMVAYLFGGVNEAMARFFSALCGLLVVMSTFWFVKRNVGEKIAFWSAISLLSSLHVIIQFRLATPDPYLILCHTLAVYFFYEGWKSQRWRWYAAMYSFLGIGILAKGPVGLLLPGLTMFLFMLTTKSLNWKTIARMKPWWGLLLVLLFSLPWYLAVHLETHGMWTRGFFVDHNLNRFHQGIGSHDGPFVLTLVFILAGMLPFSVFAIRAFRAACKRCKEDHLLKLAVVSVLVVAVFYAFSHTKLINYTSPSYPFFAIIIGHFFARLIDGEIPRSKVTPEFIAIALFALSIPVGLFFLTRNTEPLSSVSWVAWCVASFPIGAVLSLFLLKRSVKYGLAAVATTFMVSGLIFIAGPFHIMDHQSPIEKYKAMVESHENVVAYRNFDNAFAFYAQHPIPIFDTVDELENYLATHKNVLVLSRDRDLSYMDSIPNLTRIGVDHDLFSRRLTGVYHEQELALRVQ